ncbi:hypothetical protein PR001_g17269 [Phytophthora rubi]|uniref:Uncharacterized protein n=1 Tax=Phytophthora rubi TaxID=129364 RepID=A0A6A3KFN4_9STRA|nr:hypothetical protein PR001_g17269 [Phytophthora rubi]KAE9012522.1 hypothetical protein PR002_g14781 [Phytophthora rubi]
MANLHALIAANVSDELTNAQIVTIVLRVKCNLFVAGGLWPTCEMSRLLWSTNQPKRCNKCKTCTDSRRGGCFSSEEFGWSTYTFGCTTTTIRSSTPNIEIEYPLTE